MGLERMTALLEPVQIPHSSGNARQTADRSLPDRVGGERELWAQKALFGPREQGIWDWETRVFPLERSRHGMVDHISGLMTGGSPSGTEGSCTSEIVSQTQNMTTLNPSPQPDSHEIWGEHEPVPCVCSVCCSWRQACE